MSHHSKYLNKPDVLIGLDLYPNFKKQYFCSSLTFNKYEHLNFTHYKKSVVIDFITYHKDEIIRMKIKDLITLNLIDGESIESKK